MRAAPPSITWRANFPAALNSPNDSALPKLSMRESRSKRRSISFCVRPPGGTKPSTMNFGVFGLPPVTSGAYWSPRNPTSLKRPFAPVRITNGGRSPE